MSKLGKTAIELQKNVEVKVEGSVVTVKGPKGTLSLSLPKGISIKVEGATLLVLCDPSVEMPRPTYGLMRASLGNLVTGVTKGFEKKLSMVGVGYRAALQGHKLDLQVGNSHPTQLVIPSGIHVAVDKSVAITVSGVDKQAVGQFAAQIRGVKPPEPYKGKGIRYENEYVRKKDGKAAKAKTAGA